jgi:hypothetical protein
MSRTIRRKNKDPYWLYWDWTYSGYCIGHIFIDPNSQEGKKRKAQYHGDAGYNWYNSKGPGWFHNLYAQKPHRQYARIQIRKFLKNELDDVVIRDKPRREYWD